MAQVQGLAEIPRIFSAKNLLPAEMRGKKTDLIAPKDTLEMLTPKYKDKKRTLKKLGLAGASFLLPGLGQLVNGHVWKSVIMCLTFEILIKSVPVFKEPGLKVLSRLLQYYAAYDAFKKAKIPESSS